MKIFFYKYGSICEPDISDSFRRLGFEVIDEDMEIYNKNLLPSQCVETVSKKLIDGQFTFVFTINFFPWLSDLCEIMHLKYISLDHAAQRGRDAHKHIAVPKALCVLLEIGRAHV